jgi:hypothetical protein
MMFTGKCLPSLPQYCFLLEYSILQYCNIAIPGSSVGVLVDEDTDGVLVASWSTAVDQDTNYWPFNVFRTGIAQVCLEACFVFVSH